MERAPELIKLGLKNWRLTDTGMRILGRYTEPREKKLVLTKFFSGLALVS